MMIPPICLSVTKVAPSLETTKQSHNEVTKKNANQHYPSVMRETNTNLTDNTNTPRFKNLSVKSVQSVFKNPTHHALSLFSVFPDKIREIREIRVRKPYASRYDIVLRGLRTLSVKFV